MNLFLTLCFYILNLYVGVVVSSRVTVEHQYIDGLTNIFFSNLQEIPILKGEELNILSKQFIDKQIQNYMELIKKTYGDSEHSVTRRSLPFDSLTSVKNYEAGLYKLDGFIARFNIKVKSPKDIILFQSGEKEDWYAAAIENTTDNFIIFELRNGEFHEMQRISIRNGVKIVSYSSPNLTLLLVLEYNSPAKNFHERMAIFEFAANKKLKKVQSMDNPYATDAAIWKVQKSLFMIVLQHMSNKTGKINYEIDTPIYKWMGGHFDVVNHIKTFGAKAAISFHIRNSHFLAIANYQDNSGNNNIYSDIFKYNLHTEKYELHQRILTTAAADVQYFPVQFNNVEQHFLVFANAFEKDIDGTLNYETDSITYKYVDNYFIPFQSFRLNGVTQWLHLAGPHKTSILLAACKFEGVKMFYYDGWKFNELQTSYTDTAFSRGVVWMHSYYVNDTSILVIANENDHEDTMHIFEAAFVKKNDFAKLHGDILDWCQSNLKQVEATDFEKLTQQVELAPKSNNLVIDVNEKLAFKNVSARDLKIIQNTTEDIPKLKVLQDDLEKYSESLNEIEAKTNKSLKANTTNIINGDVHIKKLILNNETVFDHLNVDNINNMSVSNLLMELININEDCNIKSAVTIENATIENKILSKKFTENLVKNLKKQGNKLLPLENKDKVGAARAITETDEIVVLNSIKNLTVKNVVLEAYINNVDISSIHKYALRHTGDQVIEGKYSFDNLIVNNLNVSKLSDKNIPEDLILRNLGDYDIHYNVRFLKDIIADDITLTGRLNDIPVINGRLDVLLSNTTQLQHVTGAKNLEYVKLLKPIGLQAKINNVQSNELNPVVISDEEIIVANDLEIDGNVIIEKLLQAKDLKGTKSKLSVRHIQNKGLKLTQTKIPLHLEFEQQLHVDKLFVDRVNDVPVNSFVVTGLEEPQIVTGWKKFLSDVTVTGSTNVVNVNGFNLGELERNILKITGNQSLTGHHYFENIVANRILNVKTEFGGHFWEDIITTYEDQEIKGTTVISNSVQIKNLASTSLNFNSHINEFNFNEIINDTVFHGENKVVGGRKEFLEIIAQDAYATNLDLNALVAVIENSRATFVIDEDINLPENILIERIWFNKYFNKISSEYFGHPWIQSKDEQTINSKQNFKEVIIYGNLIIESGLINGVRLEEITENTVKIDEPFHFGTVTFLNGLASIHTVTLEGNFESLFLNDIVQSNTELEQVLVDSITFREDVNIFGELTFGGCVSGLDLPKFYKFFVDSDNRNPINLYIQGNAYFARGPEIYYINNVPIRHILENAWFKNYENEIQGVMQFNQIVFKKDLIIHNTIDEINLESIASTYFSKSQDQIVTGLLDFDGDVMFSQDVYVPKAFINEEIGGINLAEFVHTALLNKYDQVFENTVYLDTCVIKDIQGNYRINELDLQSDVMRYDAENIVTGKKIIQDVDVYSLQLDKNIKVQEVDILELLRAVVLKTGTFKLEGQTVMDVSTIFSNGITSQALVNGIPFNMESVMLKSIPQIITGKKIMLGHPEYPINIKSMKLKGLLNGVDFSKLLYNQAFINKKINFMGPLNFNAEIAAPNIEILSLYQGVNVSSLISNITKLEYFESYEDNYNKLRDVSVNVLNSLKDPAYFLDHYKILQVYQKIHAVIPFKLENDTNQYLAVVLKNEKDYTIVFNIWDKNHLHFKNYKEMENVTIPGKLNYIKIISYRGKEHWYVENERGEAEAEREEVEAESEEAETESEETETESEETETENEEVETERLKQFNTTLYTLQPTGLLQATISLSHNGTRNVASVILPNNQSCIMMLFFNVSALYCETDGTNSSAPLSLYQAFEGQGAFEVASTSIKNVPYIFVAYLGTFFEESKVNVWRYNGSKFELQQAIYIPHPNSIADISFQNNNYLAIASGYQSKYSALIRIFKYNHIAGEFLSWQDITDINVPIQIELVELPTEELILYVLTDDTSESLLIYNYEGVSGFKKKSTIFRAPRMTNILSFTTLGNDHFVLAGSVNETRILKASFKGSKSRL